jgi:hypothetical protein
VAVLHRAHDGGPIVIGAGEGLPGRPEGIEHVGPAEPRLTDAPAAPR